METYIVEWLNLFGRWIHLITGIAWIGSSFYFVFLDCSLLAPKDREADARGVGGELWSVHGGGFYHVQKYRVAPQELPVPLHWFKWEAYSTWLSGMFLLGLIYWYGAEIYLIDPSVMALGKPLAILISIGFLAGGWIIYDQLCKSRVADNDVLLSSVMFILVAVMAFALCQIYSGRGAYIMFGATLGTIMAANVFFVIIPGQKELVNAKQQGREPDPAPGITGKQRSVHNTYFTLPVLFVMISNHYAMTFGHAYNWLVLIAISMAGALIRVFFVSRHGVGKPAYIPALVGVALLAAVVIAMMPRPQDASARLAAGAGDDPGDGAVQAIIAERCAGCHAASPTQPGFTAPPKGVVYDTLDQIHAQAQQIHQQVVVTKAMPIGNLTRMTDDERAVIDAWFRQRNHKGS